MEITATIRLLGPLSLRKLDRNAGTGGRSRGTEERSGTRRQNKRMSWGLTRDFESGPCPELVAVCKKKGAPGGNAVSQYRYLTGRSRKRRT